MVESYGMWKYAPCIKRKKKHTIEWFNLLGDKEMGVSKKDEPSFKSGPQVDLTKKITVATNGRITLNNNNKNNNKNNNNNDSTQDKNITMVSGEFDGTINSNGDGDDVFNKTNTINDNFANFDAFTSSNELDLFGNIEFSSTQVDGHNMTTITSTTHAKDRFLDSLSSPITEFDKFTSRNDSFHKKFASFMTQDIKKPDDINANATTIKSSSSSSFAFQPFSLNDDEDNFADFTNANAFNAINDSHFEINTTQINKSKSTKDCDKHGKAEAAKIPSKFRDDYSKTDDFETDLQQALKLSLVDQ